jgi:hypothetical protein
MEGFKGKCKFGHPEKQEHHGLTERKAASNNCFNPTPTTKEANNASAMGNGFVP